MSDNLELRKVRDFGETISDTFVFIRQNLKPLFRCVGIICGFFIVLMMIGTIFMDSETLRMTHSIRDVNFANPTPTYFQNYGLDYFLRLIFLMVVMLLSYVSVFLTTYCYVALYREKGNLPPSVEEVWAYFKFYFFRIMGSSILLWIIFMFSLILCFAGLYLVPAFSIFLALMVIENGSFSYAWDRVFKLTKDYWWQTFGVVFVSGMIAGFASAILTIPGQILVAVQMLVTTSGFSLPLVILSGALKSLALFAQTLPAIAVCLCYYSLVEIKEGTGLLDRIDQLGKTAPNQQIPPEEY